MAPKYSEDWVRTIKLAALHYTKGKSHFDKPAIVVEDEDHLLQQEGHLTLQETGVENNAP